MIKIRRQKPVRGGRSRLPASVLGEIERKVQLDADRYHVSKSFVVSVVLANHYGIRKQEQF